MIDWDRKAFLATGDHISLLAGAKRQGHTYLCLSASILIYLAKETPGSVIFRNPSWYLYNSTWPNLPFSFWIGNISESHIYNIWKWNWFGAFLSYLLHLIQYNTLITHHTSLFLARLRLNGRKEILGAVVLLATTSVSDKMSWPWGLLFYTYKVYYIGILFLRLGHYDQDYMTREW